MLGGAVGGETGGGCFPQVGRDVDDMARPARDHAGQREFGSPQHAVEVDVDDGVGEGVGLLGVATGGHDAGVVDQHLHRRLDAGQELGERLPGPYVQSGADAADLFGGLFGHVAVQITDVHARAPGDEGLRGGKADTARTTGDGHGRTGQVDSAHRCAPVVVSMVSMTDSSPASDHVGFQ